MAKTTIEWTDYTCNCFCGCRQGCDYCQARSMARRFGRRLGEKRGYPEWMADSMARFEPVFLADQLLKIPAKPCRVFISFMGDWAGPWHEEWTRQQMFSVIKQHPQHTFQLLTKQASRLRQWSPYPDNCWVGVTVTDDAKFREAQRVFDDIVCRVRFISFEPFLDTIDTEYMPGFGLAGHICQWAIIGQRTPRRLATAPDYRDIERMIKLADKGNIKVFLKDNLRPVLPVQAPFYTRDPGICEECEAGDPCHVCGEGVTLRQEFPR